MSDGRYEGGSLTLWDTVAMGTGVMIGAGIFALTGQVAELAGSLFPLAFLLAAGVSGLSAYSYVKVTRQHPSAGGIAAILGDAYGRGTVTAACSMLMAFSMVINESLVARTFGTYVVQLLGVDGGGPVVPALAAGLVLSGFAVNVAGNDAVGTISKIAAIVKVGGIFVFAVSTLVAAGGGFVASSGSAGRSASLSGLVAGTAIGILAYKGFTTITNSGDEVEHPKRNVGRAIVVSLLTCLVVYMLVAWAVGSSLTIDEISAARDYSLAEAARPAFGRQGVVFTAVIAIVATSSGLLASLFAVSRMLAMLTDMRLVPHSHFGMAGDVQRHTLVYAAVLAGLLAVFFDLGRIASIGVVFYLVMDAAVHLGVLRHLREKVGANVGIVTAALAADVVALVVFVVVRGGDDPFIVWLSAGGVAATFAFEHVYLRVRGHDDAEPDDVAHA